MRIYKKKGVNEEYCIIKGSVAFTPVFDDTDHLHFACPKCEEIAEVLFVERRDNYAETPTVYFYLRCPKCKVQNFRKIYLEDRGKHYMQFPVTVKILAKSPNEARSGIIKEMR